MSNKFIGNTPSLPPPRASTFQWGLIGSGILASIEIVWYVLRYFWLDTSILDWFALHIPFGFVFYFCLDSVLICLPILAALPIFFWVSRQATRPTGLARAGIKAALQASGWWVIIKIALFFIDMLQPSQIHDSLPEIFLHMLDSFWLEEEMKYLLPLLLALLLALLLMFGVAWLMGTMGGKSSGSQGILQPEHYSPRLPQGSVPGASLGAYPSTPQAYWPQSPQPQSALEVLQQRFARGEIDIQTYQEMRRQLEASARPDSSQ